MKTEEEHLISDMVRSLEIHEGCVLVMYEDSVGEPTIGFGHWLKNPISKEAAYQILRDDIAIALEGAKSFDWFEGLSPLRKQVIINMIFNLGLPRFKAFKKAISAISDEDFELAAVEMLDSKWAEQVGKRAEELAQSMRLG